MNGQTLTNNKIWNDLLTSLPIGKYSKSRLEGIFYRLIEDFKNNPEEYDGYTSAQKSKLLLTPTGILIDILIKKYKLEYERIKICDNFGDVSDVLCEIFENFLNKFKLRYLSYMRKMLVYGSVPYGNVDLLPVDILNSDEQMEMWQLAENNVYNLKLKEDDLKRDYFKDVDGVVSIFTDKY